MEGTWKQPGDVRRETQDTGGARGTSITRGWVEGGVGVKQRGHGGTLRGSREQAWGTRDTAGGQGAPGGGVRDTGGGDKGHRSGTGRSQHHRGGAAAAHPPRRLPRPAFPTCVRRPGGVVSVTGWCRGVGCPSPVPLPRRTQASGHHLQLPGKKHVKGGGGADNGGGGRHRHLHPFRCPPGPICNHSFDMYACWGDAAPNSTVTVPCPWYLPWCSVQDGVVARCCRPGGRDHSQCEDLAQEQLLQMEHTMGYSLSLSLIALLLALLLLLLFRHLHCTCNLIHANLFLSMLQAGTILTWDALLQHRLHPSPGHPLQLLWCQLAQALTHYCVWGLFLHKLLVLAATPCPHMPPHPLLNLVPIPPGAPVLFVIPWVVVRYLYENKGCWERNKKVAVWWIIRCPILMAVAVNFVVFVCIIHILVAKVQAHQVSHGDTRVRLARSTLMLIPLLGVHEVAFTLVGEGQGGGTLCLVQLCLQLLLSASQGLIVSVLYSFVNKEVCQGTS
uniref:G-protein coupled receptors family 2 profile 2 domain-containing protein n=1 Tax=Accipiter nisus TaxID=211598 RepID=A0A8B9M9B2_9AVES